MDESDRTIGQKITEILIGIVFGGRIRFETEMSTVTLDGDIETAAAGVLVPSAQVPLAKHRGGVADSFQ